MVVVMKMQTAITRHIAGAALLLAVCTPLPAASPAIVTDHTPLNASTPALQGFAPIVERAAPSVVNIYSTKSIRADQGMAPFMEDPLFRRFFGMPFENVPRERREQALGSGVIVTPDGYILTNNHVVNGADRIKVALNDNQTSYDAKLVGTDPQTDIALIKVDAENLPAITLTDSDLVRVGDIALAIGNPFGIGQTVTMGIVSAKSRGGMGIVDYEDFIQTDASINPGNSGGALVDAAGRLIGINQSIISRSGGNQGVGFAVPSNLAKYVMERLAADGKVTRGYLGVVIQPMTTELAEAFGLENNQGALVGEVQEDSPAAKAGIKAGDVIVAFDGRAIADSRQLRLLASQTPPGAKASVKLLRDGQARELEVTLGELPGEGLARANGESKQSTGGDLLKGVTVDDPTSNLLRRFSIPQAVEGAVVVAVEPDSPAARAGLSPGDVIMEIGRQPVANADEAVEAGRKVGGDQALLRVWSRGAIRFVVVTK